ncbi:MAG: ornithine aminomutase subunit alpha [Clostridiales bacterium]|jgi:D-ornithine 4,5-aminomutase subunit alpha|nr:ornithine aminomutase subunit alpha [Clostridiales bacterium]
MKRIDEFSERRKHLQYMDDDQLREYFWELTQKVVEPLLKLGYENTSPSIERSVLLRMGFSSIEAKPIVDEALTRGLLSHGAGNIVYKLAKRERIGIREAGLALANGQKWDEAVSLFSEAL